MIKVTSVTTKRFQRLSAIGLLCAILSGCGSTPVKENAASNNLTLDQIPDVIDEAITLDGATKYQKLIEASEALVELNEDDWARNTLLLIDATALNGDLLFKYSILSAKLAIKDGKPYLAKSYLWDETLESIYPSISPEEQIKFHELRASLLFDLAEFEESVEERLILSGLLYLSIEALENNHDLLWQALMELPLKELQQKKDKLNSRIAQGWYTLAALSKDNQTNLQKQLKAVDEWTFYWPEHPASLRLPADLQLLKQLAAEQPQHIALLLPLSGKLQNPAKAIRDGFMAAYYQTLAEGSEQAPQIHVYDTSTTEINSVYEQATLDGAEMVIGPLNKTNISSLALSESLTSPILALNQVDSEVPETAPLYQFGLTIEDEAKQVAEQAWRDGHRRAMVLAPASTWGDRGVSAFLERWLELGGFVSKDYRFKNQKTYSQLVKNAVQVKDSELRAREVRRQLGKSIEFEPRRRQDIDYIFLIGNASQARQLKPTLAFHYSGDIPVYSISHIYNGKVDTKLDRDMNNIRFTTLPWFFDEDLPEKHMVDTYTKGSAAYQRLYALGVDAFHIYPRLRQLDSIEKSKFYGTTGTLNIGEQRKIQRKQTWAQFIQGKAKEASNLTSNQDY